MRFALNNGRVVPGYGYKYDGELAQVQAGDITSRHSDSNLLTCGGYQWWLPLDNEDLTRYPKSAHPQAKGVVMDTDKAILRQLLEGHKPAGQMLAQNREEAEEWARQLRQAGLDVAIEAYWHPMLPWKVWACPAKLTADDDWQLLAEWRRIAPGDLGESIIDAISEAQQWSLGEFKTHHEQDFGDWRSLAITGYVLGYPPLTTLAVLERTQS